MDFLASVEGAVALGGREKFEWLRDHVMPGPGLPWQAISVRELRYVGLKRIRALGIELLHRSATSRGAR